MAGCLVKQRLGQYQIFVVYIRCTSCVFHLLLYRWDLRTGSPLLLEALGYHLHLYLQIKLLSVPLIGTKYHSHQSSQTHHLLSNQSANPSHLCRTQTWRLQLRIDLFFWSRLLDISGKRQVNSTAHQWALSWLETNLRPTLIRDCKVSQKCWWRRCSLLILTGDAILLLFWTIARYPGKLC